MGGLHKDQLTQQRRTLLQTIWVTPLITAISLPTHANTSDSPVDSGSDGDGNPPDLEDAPVSNTISGRNFGCENLPPPAPGSYARVTLSNNSSPQVPLQINSITTAGGIVHSPATFPATIPVGLFNSFSITLRNPDGASCDDTTFSTTITVDIEGYAPYVTTVSHPDA